MRLPEAHTPIRPHPPKVGNVLVTPLILWVSMAGDNRLPSGDMPARLAAVL